MLKDYRIAPTKNGKPGHAVIFLHGVGDSGMGGLLSIGQMWRQELPDTEFLCPDAPFPFDMAPVGFQWFSLQDFSQESILRGAKMAAPILNDYIDHVLATRDLPANRLALVGFSQGTIMALYVAPRRPDPIAGIVGYSGLLIGHETLATEKKSSPPVLLIHGTLDETVPFSYMKLSEKALHAAGIPAASQDCPALGHSIDDKGLAAGLQFLKTVFG